MPAHPTWRHCLGFFSRSHLLRFLPFPSCQESASLTDCWEKILTSCWSWWSRCSLSSGWKRISLKFYELWTEFAYTISASEPAAFPIFLLSVSMTDLLPHLLLTLRLLHVITMTITAFRLAGAGLGWPERSESQCCFWSCGGRESGFFRS